MVNRLAHQGLALSVVVGSGCGWNYTPSDNILPEPVAEDPSTDDGPPLPETGETGGLEPFPATYRIDCIDIQSLGDADETVFQVSTLQTTWSGDIANFKLNILIDLVTEDPDTGTGVATIRSGVGFGWSDQCSQADTASMEFPLTYEPGVAEWEAVDAEGQCAQAGATSASGTYEIELGAADVIYIYSEDDDGTSFNCSLEQGAPQAIPISALSSTLSSSEDRSVIAGTLTGCMVRSEAENICSCLSVCNGQEHPDCPGCPGGAVPLGLLLGGINSTSHCTDLMGEEAFDVTLQYTARRLADVPTTCQ